MYKERRMSRTLTMLLAIVIVLGGVMIFQMSHGLTADAATTLVNESTVSSTNINKGQKVTVYGAASGGAGGYQYAYYVKKTAASSWVTGKSYSTAASYTLKPSSAEKYDMMVKVKDSSGKVAKKIFTVTVNPALQSKASVSTTSITKGMSLKAYGAAEGGSGKYQYAYYFKRASSSSWSTAKSYSTSKVVSIKPTAAVDYDVMVKIKDTNGSVVKSTFRISVAPALVLNPSLSGTSFLPEQDILVKASASGGSGSYQFSFSYKSVSSSNWISLLTYGSEYAGIYFSVADSGSFEVLVKVRDSNGAVASAKIPFTVGNDTINSMVDDVLDAIIRDGMDDFDKVKAIHDWIIDNTRYDYDNLVAGTIPDSSYTAEGLLVTHVAVCDGYAKTFALMAQRAGLDAIRVTGLANSGSGSQSHAWNQVKVGGKWFNIDVTWDDPVMADGSDVRQYNYFLVPDSVLNKDHTAQSQKNSCKTAQPKDRILKEMLADFEGAYAVVSSKEEIANAMQDFADRDILEFYLIYQTDKDYQSIRDEVFSCGPQVLYDYSMRLGFQNFGLDGYSLLSIKIDVITGYQ